MSKPHIAYGLVCAALFLASLFATPGATAQGTLPTPAVYAPVILLVAGPPTAAPTATSKPPAATPTPTATAAIDCPCDQGDVRNCPDFDTQPEAQSCYDRCIALVGVDVHRLDQGGEPGKACESLPPGWAVLH